MNIGDGRGGLPSGNSFISLLLVTLIAICVLVWSKAAGVVLGAVGGYARWAWNFVGAAWGALYGTGTVWVLHAWGAQRRRDEEEIGDVRRAVAGGRRAMLSFDDCCVDAEVLTQKNTVMTPAHAERLAKVGGFDASAALVVPEAHLRRAAWFMEQLSKPEKKK